MTPTEPFNAYHTQCRDLDDLVTAVTRRYGPGAQAEGYVLYEQLITLRRLLADDPTAIVVAARIRSLRERLGKFYALSTPDLPSAPTRIVSADPFVVEFDRAAFRAYGYDKVADRVATETVTLSPCDHPKVVSGAAYLYVITEGGDVRLWLRPFRLADLSFGRDRARIGGVPVAHPMLIPTTLRATGAGEIIFIRSESSREGEISAAITNTKSGHFRPPPTAAPWARSQIASALAIDERDVDMIVIP